jgi:hypothetical protein
MNRFRLRSALLFLFLLSVLALPLTALAQDLTDSLGQEGGTISLMVSGSMNAILGGFFLWLRNGQQGLSRDLAEVQLTLQRTREEYATKMELANLRQELWNQLRPELRAMEDRIHSQFSGRIDRMEQQVNQVNQGMMQVLNLLGAK